MDQAEQLFVTQFETDSRGAVANGLPNANVCARVLTAYMPALLAQIDAGNAEAAIKHKLGIDVHIDSNVNIHHDKILNTKEVLASFKNYCKERALSNFK
jgi:hypothetical protein